ncbi:L,D-transpeptidase Cds6 family protein [Neptunomonas qingdaonensis]|uniref:Cds6 C-terminal domain-containing protein n=1 Tax=Neptunomonas qingdaonensis TaxID=1045558 RepID=A0A1I2S5S3_9GAMM|nr:hypothetical protein [Neptunomonas qingdaonensis]SFG46197.1 hypothetical protein SAMN05216175_10748 [Neptunomonas qingdaonensis]
MTSGQIFRHNSRLSSRLNPGLTSPLPEKDLLSANWLLQVLPDFGIVQLDGGRAASIVAQFEQLIDTPLLRWNSTEQFSDYAQLLADALDFPSAEYVYLQHRLRVWAEQSAVLWILVEGDNIPNEQLVELLRFRPLSRSGQFAIRILLKVSADKQRDTSFAPLAQAIHERVGEPLPVKHRSYNPDRFKVYAAYLLILVLSAASITTTWYLTSQEKSALAKTEDADDVLPPVMSSNRSQSQSVETPPLQAPADMDTLKVAVVSIDPPEIDTPQIDTTETDAPETQRPDIQIDSVSQSEISEVIALIERWSGAWQQQNIDEYFSMYSSGYSADKTMSSNEWRSWRTARLKKPLWISIEIGPMAVKRGAEGELQGELTGELKGELNKELHATFWQLYRSAGYQDDTLKTLVLRKEAGIWKIAGEINQEVRPLSQE